MRRGNTMAVSRRPQLDVWVFHQLVRNEPHRGLRSVIGDACDDEPTIRELLTAGLNDRTTPACPNAVPMTAIDCNHRAGARRLRGDDAPRDALRRFYVLPARRQTRIRITGIRTRFPAERIRRIGSVTRPRRTTRPRGIVLGRADVPARWVVLIEMVRIARRRRYGRKLGRIRNHDVPRRKFGVRLENRAKRVGTRIPAPGRVDLDQIPPFRFLHRPAAALLATAPSDQPPPLVVYLVCELQTWLLRRPMHREPQVANLTGWQFDRLPIHPIASWVGHGAIGDGRSLNERNLLGSFIGTVLAGGGILRNVARAAGQGQHDEPHCAHMQYGRLPFDSVWMVVPHAVRGGYQIGRRAQTAIGTR